MKRSLIITLILAIASVSIGAQALYMPRNVKRAFEAGTRSADGRPGPKYWQNKATYNISINVAPPNRTITGSEEITYVNNSPNTLEQIVFRLQLNSHVAEAPREDLITTDYLTTGVHIDEFTINGVVKPWQEQKGATAQRVRLGDKLAPGGTVKFTFKWHVDMSVQSGREGAIDATTFFLAYFYPRVAVYDDTDGWDAAYFTEGHEFYNDFNDYTFEVNSPKNFVVWATGDLLNAQETLQPQIAERLKRSFTADDVVHVATLDELKAGSVTKQSDTVKWRWKADNVSDVALAVSDHYIWDAGSVVVDNSTKRRASVQAAYNVEAADFQKMVEYGKHALDWCSNNYPGVPYPFQKTTIVRGFADMEYPMMVNDSSFKDPNFSRFVVEHEILHSWFPFYMGINEQRYGFMDEGWTTAFEFLIGTNDMGEPTAENLFKNFRVQRWIKSATADGDLPIITPADGMAGAGYRDNEYGKGALAHLAVKDLLGDVEFKKALHEFMARWNGKHPLPWDMFNSFNSATGKDLNWFFNNWYFTNSYIDLAVREVKQPATGDATITIANIGGFCAPVNVIVTYDDATTEKFHQTPVIWTADQRTATVSVPAKKKIRSLVLDGGIWMDANEKDNTWAAN